MILEFPAQLAHEGSQIIQSTPVFLSPNGCQYLSMWNWDTRVHHEIDEEVKLFWGKAYQLTRFINDSSGQVHFDLPDANGGMRWDLGRFGSSHRGSDTCHDFTHP